VTVAPTLEQRFGSVPTRGLEVRRKVYEQMAESNPTVGSGDTFIIRIPARSFIDLRSSVLRFDFTIDGTDDLGTGPQLSTWLGKSAHSIFRRVQVRDGRGNQLSDLQEYGRLHRIGLDVMVAQNTIDSSSLWMEGIANTTEMQNLTMGDKTPTFTLHLNSGIFQMRDLYPALMTDGMEIEITIADFRKFLVTDTGVSPPHIINGVILNNISYLYTVVDFTPTYVQAYQNEAATNGVMLHYPDHRHVQSSVTGSDEISLGNSIKSVKAIYSGFYLTADENNFTDIIGTRNNMDILDWQFFLGADPYPARRVQGTSGGKGGSPSLWHLKQAFGIENSAGLHSQGNITYQFWGDVVGDGTKFAIGYEFEGDGFSGVNKIGDEIRLNYNFGSAPDPATNHSWIYFEKLARVTPSGIVVELNPT